jgi:hypothetical protein
MSDSTRQRAKEGFKERRRVAVEKQRLGTQLHPKEIAIVTCAICGIPVDPIDITRKKPLAAPGPPFYCEDCWCCPNCGDPGNPKPQHDDDPWHIFCTCGEIWDRWEEFDRDLSLYHLHRAMRIQATFQQRGPFIDRFGR